MNKTCSIQKIENGFLVSTSIDPNDYEQSSFDYENASFAPVERKLTFAGSPASLGEIVVAFYE